MIQIYIDRGSALSEEDAVVVLLALFDFIWRNLTRSFALNID